MSDFDVFQELARPWSRVTIHNVLLLEAEEQSLLAAAERQGKRDFAAAQLADARRRHGSALKLGQLWWTWWQVRGLVGAHVPAPACTSEEDGLDTLTKGRLDNLPVSNLMRKW